MSKLYAKAASFFYIAAALSLVACGGQTVKPEEDATVDVSTSAPVPEPVKEVTPEPTVEVMPQMQMDKHKIAVEPIPEKELSDEEPVVVSAPEKTVAVPEPVVSASKPVEAKAKKVPVSSGPTHFVVTVGPKERSHPAYGKGHAMGFLIDGISGKELVVERGKLYTFEIVTNPKHDVYLSKKAVGWGGAPYVTGVEGAYTYKGNMTIKADKSTPDQLFYACRNHPYMGGVVHVVNKGQKVDIKQQVAASAAAGAEKSARKVTVTQAKVKQKLMFAEMMAGAQGAKRVLASQNDEARRLVVSAKKKLAEGRKKSMVGSLPEALALANESLKMLSEASRLVPSDAELAHQAEDYKTMLAEIQDYQKSYKSNIKRMQKKGDVPDDVKMDENKLAATLAKAKALAGKKNYVRANGLLKQAQVTITKALHKILDSKTIVYDLKFDTAADEYEYELKRFAGYEELIPVAIEAKKPAPGAIKLMKSFLAKAHTRRDEAIAKADSGDYPMAISMLLQATKTVRRALRMVGVSQ